ncbi:MAG: hypothetical protein EXQ92_05225 [Alphaproteobacteria bacterium]|nr:hypothetical protein [Alphaproteobacteria bacterium]
MIKPLIPIAFLLSLTPMAVAQEAPRLIGTFERWTAYSYAEKGVPACYAAAKPATSRGAPDKRGEIFLLVTHRPNQKTFDVVSFVAGYAFKKGEAAELTIGKDKFKLFTEAERAWAPDDKTDRAIAQAMVKAGEMVLRGTPAKGQAVIDTFSLKGFTRAYDAISKACKVKRS